MSTITRNPSDPKNASSIQKTVKAAGTSAIVIIVVIILFLLVILILIAIIFAYTKKIYDEVNSPVTIQPGIWAIFDLDFLCGPNGPSSSCVSPNGSTPYGRMLFPTKGDRPFLINSLGQTQQLEHICGAHPYTMQDAVLVFYENQRMRNYDALTTYLYSTPGTPGQPGVTDGRLQLSASVGDSIDNWNTPPRPGDSPDYLAVVVSPNPNMLKVVQDEWQKNLTVFPQSQAQLSIQWKYYPIPTRMYAKENFYCIFTRILPTPQNNNVITYNCWWIHAETVEVPKSDVPPSIIPRIEPPNEYTIYWNDDRTQWPILAKQTLQNNFPGVELTPIPASAQAKGFFSWVPCVCPDVDPTQLATCGIVTGYQGLECSLNLRFDNDAVSYMVCGTFQVPPGYLIVVASLNHVATTAVSSYSNITFTNAVNESSWAGVLTGLGNPPDSGLPQPQPASSPPVVITTMPVPDSARDPQTGVATIYCTERAYVNGISRTGPQYASIAPLQVYLVPATAVSPSQITIPYPFSMS